MAIVSDEEPRESIWRLTSCHTFPWSERWPRPSFAARLTDFFRMYRSLEDEWLPLDPKWRDLYRHRPCSTQLTGIVVLLRAAIRTDVFSTRFCFAPRSSSPSMKRTRESLLFSTRRLGTDPASPNSSTTMFPAAIASSESR